MTCHWCKLGHIKKSYHRYKEFIKKNIRSTDDTKGKGNHARVVKELEYPCDVLTAESGRGKYTDTWLLRLKVHISYMPKKSTYKTIDR